jgi:hypothetical protein
VSYEQAKKLKELGFDWDCRTCYGFFFDDNEVSLSVDSDNISLTNYNSSFYSDNECDSFSAPTVALALQWFREVKYVDNGIAIQLTEDGFRYYHIYQIGDEEYIDGSLDILYFYYEEAESALLDKLIEFEMEKKK